MTEQLNWIGNCSKGGSLKYITPDVCMIFDTAALMQSYWGKNLFYFLRRGMLWSGLLAKSSLVWGHFLYVIHLIYTYFQHMCMYIYTHIHYIYVYKHIHYFQHFITECNIFSLHSDTHFTKYVLLPNHGNCKWGSLGIEKCPTGWTAENYSQEWKPSGVYLVG